jgi:AcrR family transcriptional regulator
MTVRAKTTEKKQQIIKIALDIFDQFGIENTTIEMICTATNTSIGSLYHHFGSKEGLAAKVYLSGLQQFSTRLLHAMQDCQTAQQAVFCIVENNVDWIDQNRTWAKFIFEHGNIIQQTQQQATMSNAVLSMQQQFEALFSQLEDHHIFNAWPREIITSLLVGAVHDYAKQWFKTGCSSDFLALKPYFAQAAWQSLQIKN